MPPDACGQARSFERHRVPRNEILEADRDLEISDQACLLERDVGPIEVAARRSNRADRARQLDSAGNQLRVRRIAEVKSTCQPAHPSIGLPAAPALPAALPAMPAVPAAAVLPAIRRCRDLQSHYAQRGRARETGTSTAATASAAPPLAASPPALAPAEALATPSYPLAPPIQPCRVACHCRSHGSRSLHTRSTRAAPRDIAA